MIIVTIFQTRQLNETLTLHAMKLILLKSPVVTHSNLSHTSDDDLAVGLCGVKL